MFASEHLRRVAVALLGAAALLPAFGQQANSREQEIIRRLRQQVQQLQQDQANQQQAAQRANSEKTAAQAKLDAAAAQLRRAQQAASTQAKSAGETQKELEALRQEHAALQAGTEAIKVELQDSKTGLAKLRGEHTQLQGQLTQREAAYADIEARHGLQAQGLQACSANNQALYSLGQELLQRYANKGLGETLAQAEPFLQFKRVALENLVQGYQDKLDQRALKPAPATSESGRAP